MMRAGRLAREATTNPAVAQVLQDLRRVNARVSVVVAALLALAAVTMAVARYAV